MSENHSLFYALRGLAVVGLLACTHSAKAQKVDYSVMAVPEERSLNLVQITRDNDYVCMPQVNRSQNGVEWYTNRILGVTPDGSEIAYLTSRNNATNIFIKSIDRQGASRQRTNRSAILDFTFSPDGKEICFTEQKGNVSQVFTTDAHNGYVCRQITSGNQDYSPVFDAAKKNIFFTRAENRGYSIWGYDMANNFLSAFAPGIGASPAPKDETIYVARISAEGLGEIWKFNYRTGEEVCVLSDPQLSFYSPQVSPDGKRLVCTGSAVIDGGNFHFWNTDIYTINTDGSNLCQITYHAADDLSPVWSADGKHIYFISQRGSANGTANVWRMDFTPIN